MSKRPRRSKAKFKARGKFKQFSATGISQRAESPMVPAAHLPATRQVSGFKPLVTIADMAARYGYVLKELKYIGIVAGAMFVLLIILSFFFR